MREAGDSKSILKRAFDVLLEKHFPAGHIVGGAALYALTEHNPRYSWRLKDVDIFDPADSYLDNLTPLYESEFAITYKAIGFPWLIQVIKASENQLGDLLKTFDLSLSRISYDASGFHACRSFNHEPFSILESKNALYTFSRVLKFVKRGFEFDMSSLALLHGVEMDLTKFLESLGES